MFHNRLIPLLVLVTALLWSPPSMLASTPTLERDVAYFAGLNDRSMGSTGADQAAEYIFKQFTEAGLSSVGTQKFLHPVPEASAASLQVDGVSMRLFPWGPNMAYLPMTPEEGLTGSLVYVGDGNLENFQGHAIHGAIVVMNSGTGGNWMNAAMLGASALIYLGDRDSTRNEYQQQNIPTPVAFPRFWISSEGGQRLQALAAKRDLAVTVTARTRWQNKLVRNVYGLIPGKSEKLKEELIILEAFYDASSPVLGLAPGADEAVSIGALLTLARHLGENPPERSVLLVATTGNAQGLAGMREFTWAATTRKKAMRDQERRLDIRKKEVDHLLDLLKEAQPLDLADKADRGLIWQLVVNRARDKADELGRETQIQRLLRGSALQESAVPKTDPETEKIETDAETSDKDRRANDFEPDANVDPRDYRRLASLNSSEALTGNQRQLAEGLLRGARRDLKAERDELKLRLQSIKSSQQLRTLLGDFTSVLVMGLHLSSHSLAVGLTEMGNTYPWREEIKRRVRSFRLNEILTQLAGEIPRHSDIPGIIFASLATHGSGGKAPNHFCNSCDAAAIADLPAVSLSTLEDNRALWSTPADTLDQVDTVTLRALEGFLPALFTRFCSHPQLAQACEGGIRGFASLNGQAMFQRQGELFPDQPAAGTLICAIQGQSVFRTLVYRDGTFHLPGVANKRIAFEKVLLEPYGLDPRTGRVAWTADKKQTDKDNYRVKIKGDVATIALTMFHCGQTDVLPLFDPRKMDYLTKVQLVDAATGAWPLRYWYSRVDGRDTNAISVFLEKGTRFKLIMSDNLLHKQLLLLNSSQDQPTGRGFLIGEPASIQTAPFQVAQDLRLVLRDRIANLHQRGIVNRYLEDLYDSTSRELQDADAALKERSFGRFWERSIAAWAKLNVVYSEVENTQRDVLAGVLFFIALFVPFAYCMERYLFCFRGVYQQIAAFLLILLMTIFTIKALHPAFQLTYNPMVVILAFFIVGLSLMVVWIIFLRFEHEMAELQRHAAHLTTSQVSKWQAFGAGFAIGVSNLNRRKLRTALTCATLVILTFTVMSFTNVKSIRSTSHTRIADSAPYQGVMVRHQYRRALLPLLMQDLETRFRGVAGVWSRAWIPLTNGGDRILARIHGKTPNALGVEGILGLGSDPPESYRGLVTHGRWFQPEDRDAALLPLSAAHHLGLEPGAATDAMVTFWGTAFRVIGFFDDNRMDTYRELDGDPLTPAYLEGAQSEGLTEAEVEAIQAGEEFLPIAEKFRYARGSATIILPYATCMAYGGELKSIAILPEGGQPPLDLADQLSTWLGFPLFVGQDAIYFQSASTTLRYQGVANLLVPILIVIFICLNTLIGHVHERRKEISIYTSVGLAPTHVGFLFIIEALSLAVISTVAGYILAQLTAKFLGQTTVFSQLTFNYSSLASVACMVLVFSVVFISALYPARLAAEMAMPDVNRSWSLPAAVDDRISMNLPFLMKYEEEQGIMGFLTAFFLSYQDTAQGTFIVDNTSMGLEGLTDLYGYDRALQMADRGAPVVKPMAPVCVLLRANIWLAPFDFGIKQNIVVHCCPSEENPGYLELSIQMERISGEATAWIRANKHFIQALRKQMLLWRLMDQDAKTYYAGTYALGGEAAA